MSLLQYSKITTTLTVTTLLIAGISTTRVFGCAQVSSPARPLAQIATENALILYDKKTGTEHFIRQAVFDPSQDAKDFGFLVPTPTPPTLTTADSKLLSQMEEYTQPRVVYRTQSVYWFEPPRTTEAGSTSAASVSQWVQVKEQRIGDMDAAIMQAGDAATLRRWLKVHGYATRPALDKWVASYIKRGWTITAFKVATDKIADDVDDSFISSVPIKRVLAPVRMTFRTPYPFYPYQEPAEEKPTTSFHRKLRILYFGPERVHGKLSTDMAGMFPQQEEEWSTSASLSRALEEDQRKQIATLARLKAIPGQRLTVFEETGKSRPSDKDLYFLPTINQSVIEKTVYVKQYRYIDQNLSADTKQSIRLIIAWVVVSSLVIYAALSAWRNRNAAP